MVKNNIVYKEFIFENIVFVVEFKINNILVNIKKNLGYLQFFGEKIVCLLNWNEYLDSFVQYKEIGYYGGVVLLYVDVMYQFLQQGFCGSNVMQEGFVIEWGLECQIYYFWIDLKCK